MFTIDCLITIRSSSVWVTRNPIESPKIFTYGRDCTPQALPTRVPSSSCSDASPALSPSFHARAVYDFVKNCFSFFGHWRGPIDSLNSAISFVRHAGQFTDRSYVARRHAHFLGKVFFFFVFIIFYAALYRIIRTRFLVTFKNFFCFFFFFTRNIQSYTVVHNKYV